MSGQSAELPVTACCRRFNLGDAMIAIAALTPGLAAAPMHFGGLASAAQDSLVAVSHGIESSAWTSLPAAFTRLCGHLYNLTITFLLFLPPAQLLFRLRRPRPPLSLIAFQPGTAASVVMILAYSALLYLALLQIIPITIIAGAGIGASVVVTWLAMAMTGHWHAERSWVDRMGIVLGSLGVASLPLIFWLAWG